MLASHRSIVAQTGRPASESQGTAVISLRCFGTRLAKCSARRAVDCSPDAWWAGSRATRVEGTRGSLLHDFVKSEMQSLATRFAVCYQSSRYPVDPVSSPGDASLLPARFPTIPETRRDLQRPRCRSIFMRWPESGLQAGPGAAFTLFIALSGPVVTHSAAASAPAPTASLMASRSAGANRCST